MGTLPAASGLPAERSAVFLAGVTDVFLAVFVEIPATVVAQRSHLVRPMIGPTVATNTKTPIITGMKPTIVAVSDERLAWAITSFTMGIATPTPTITATATPITTETRFPVA